LKWEPVVFKEGGGDVVPRSGVCEDSCSCIFNVVVCQEIMFLRWKKADLVMFRTWGSNGRVGSNGRLGSNDRVGSNVTAMFLTVDLESMVQMSIVILN
jgi:hypothetical protein